MEKPKPDVETVLAILENNRQTLNDHNSNVALLESALEREGNKMDTILASLPSFDVNSEHVYAVDLYFGGGIYTMRGDQPEFSHTVEFDDNSFIGHEFKMIDGYLFLINHELKMAFSGAFKGPKMIHLLTEPQSKPYFGYDYFEIVNGGQL